VDPAIGILIAALRFDRRHIFNLAAIAETPQFANRACAPWLELEVSGIYRKSSGAFRP